MNTSEYLTNVYRLIADNFRSNDPSGGMTAASAAYLAKRNIGEHSDFGFPRFKDVLVALSGEGRLRFGPNSKLALAIWLTPSAQVIERPISSPGFRPLRSQVWFAFITREPEGKRYLNLHNGDVRLGCTDSPGADWVEINPIPEDDERAGAVQFLDDNKIEDADVRALLDDERWFAKLPLKLASISPDLARNWKRNRSSRVVAYVTKWCTEKGVDQSVVFESPSATSQSRMRHVGGYPLPIESNEVLRTALLDAITRMSNDELLNVSIPASHLVAVLRPDLLR